MCMTHGEHIKLLLSPGQPFTCNYVVTFVLFLQSYVARGYVQPYTVARKVAGTHPERANENATASVCS